MVQAQLLSQRRHKSPHGSNVTPKNTNQRTQQKAVGAVGVLEWAGEAAQEIEVMEQNVLHEREYATAKRPYSIAMCMPNMPVSAQNA